MHGTKKYVSANSSHVPNHRVWKFCSRNHLLYVYPLQYIMYPLQYVYPLQKQTEQGWSGMVGPPAGSRPHKTIHTICAQLITCLHLLLAQIRSVQIRSAFIWAMCKHVVQTSTDSPFPVVPFEGLSLCLGLYSGLLPGMSGLIPSHHFLECFSINEMEASVWVAAPWQWFSKSRCHPSTAFCVVYYVNKVQHISWAMRSMCLKASPWMLNRKRELALTASCEHCLYSTLHCKCSGITCTSFPFVHSWMRCIAFEVSCTVLLIYCCHVSYAMQRSTTRYNKPRKRKKERCKCNCVVLYEKYCSVLRPT